MEIKIKPISGSRASAVNKNINSTMRTTCLLKNYLLMHYLPGCNVEILRYLQLNSSIHRFVPELIYFFSDSSSQAARVYHL